MTELYCWACDDAMTETPDVTAAAYPVRAYASATDPDTDAPPGAGTVKVCHACKVVIHRSACRPL
jgi:hypothetical protein